MRRIETPRNTCISCGYAMDSATDTQGEHTPVAGDFSICFKCAHLGVFRDDLTIREPTEEELKIAQAMPLLVRARQMIIRKEHG